MQMKAQAEVGEVKVQREPPDAVWNAKVEKLAALSQCGASVRQDAQSSDVVGQTGQKRAGLNARFRALSGDGND